MFNCLFVVLFVKYLLSHFVRLSRVQNEWLLTYLLFKSMHIVAEIPKPFALQAKLGLFMREVSDSQTFDNDIRQEALVCLP